MPQHEQLTGGFYFSVSMDTAERGATWLHQTHDQIFAAGSYTCLYYTLVTQSGFLSR